MVGLSRKVDYALVGLAHLIGRPNEFASAREIAQRHGLPLPLLMQILKRLHRANVLTSSRGVKGGYQIAINLDELSLARLIDIIDANVGKPAPLAKRMSMLPPVQGFQYRLIRFLQDLKVTDLVKPGRRIDVPVESITFNEKHGLPQVALA